MSTREEIEKIIASADNGKITAEAIVEAARDEASYPALNKHLWQVAEADLAMEARIARAHKLIFNLHITTGEGTTTRMMVHTRGIPGYQPLESVVAQPDLAALKMQQLADDINRARGRLRSFRAALPETVSDEIDDLLAKAHDRASEVATRAPALQEAEAAA